MTLPAEATGSAPGRGRLAGRRVLVVGAGTRPSPEPDPPMGNGRAISVLAAREGAAVACADRDAGAAEATAALVRDEGQIAAVVLADVVSPQACTSVVAESAAALGGLDGLVLNVGIGLGRGTTGTTAAQWDTTFAVNTRAHFLVAAAALPVLEPGSADRTVTRMRVMCESRGSRHDVHMDMSVMADRLRYLLRLDGRGI